jgi:hypothetical protein
MDCEYMSKLQQVKVTGKNFVLAAAAAIAFAGSQPAASASSDIPTLEAYAMTHSNCFTEIAFGCLLLAAAMLLRRKSID